MKRAGYVLTGGRSSRMGRDKALLPFDHGTMAAAVAGKVEQAAGSATLVGSEAAHARLGYAFLPDAWPGEGPLGAIVSVLGRTEAESNLIVACDMPGLTVEFLARLMAAMDAAAKRPDVLAAAGPGGRIEPLCAVWRRRAHARAERAFAAGERGVMALLTGEDLRVELFETSEAFYFQNVNTPEDWAAYEC
ncbi:MAG: molybdenum cofactor guanylyltransferase [Bryobacteraceae bacterium]